ncbi:terminase large subunit [Microbacterium phage A3Wally]|nr:terminase large subunit [Microbacterium phage A3Wally]
MTDPFAALEPDPSKMSIMEQLALLPEAEQEAALEGLDPESIQWDWSLWSRPQQVPPKDDSWDVGLALAGRGFGKTRMASEWVREKARSGRDLRFLLVARTAADVREVIVEGEALALDTPVASPESPTGFVPIGKLKKGDIVVGGDGKPATVTEAFPVLYNRPCFAVKVAGESEPIIADADHKWLVRRRTGTWGTGRINKQTYVMTTAEIAADIDRRYYIDPIEIQGEDDVVLRYTPYNVGFILGEQTKPEEYTDHTAETRSIPEDYFWAPVKVREQVLQGLVDARQALGEGSEIPGTNTHLIRRDLRRLASSLGYMTGEYTRFLAREGRVDTWTVTRFNRRGAPRAIQSITPVPSVPVRCIAVNSPDNTFLIHNSYVKTHNSGIIAVSPPSERPEYRPSIRRLIWPNGSQAFCTSADEPDSLRGVQAHYAWGDELAAWRQPTKEGELSAWDNLRIATRLGANPQILATTTPKRVKVLFDLLEEKKTNKKIWTTHGSTFDNAGNLAGAYLDAITGVYGGTALALQELYGNMLEAVEGALWTDEMIDQYRTTDLTSSQNLRIIGVDPTVAEEPGDECGIVVVSSTADKDLYRRHAFVLEDASVQGSPEKWASKVVEMHHRWGAPIVAETNQGAALIKNAIHQIDPSVPVYEVHSKVGKKLRAEPIVLAYQQGRVHHFGRHVDLETQMVSWEPESTRKSPDRIDALVHALTALLIEPPKGFWSGPIRAKGVADRQINIGGLRQRTARTGPRATGFGGFSIGGIKKR